MSNACQDHTNLKSWIYFYPFIWADLLSRRQSPIICHQCGWSINFGFLFKLSPINQVIRWVNFWKGIKWCWFVTFLCASDDTVIVHISSVATYSTIYHSINFMTMITNQRIRTRFLQKSDNNHYQDPDHENKRRECGASIFVDLSTCKIHLYLVTGTDTSLMSTLASSFFASAGS